MIFRDKFGYAHYTRTAHLIVQQRLEQQKRKKTEIMRYSGGFGSIASPL